ncbi:MAG: hypothetical protein PHW01_00280 [Patescibacteria group bacterium]|nr:hypothetical protein [Patescibacteria group bacterium]
MNKKSQKKTNNSISTDEEIRKLVVARLKTISPDTIKCIGNAGYYSRDQLIAHVQKGDNIGKTIEKVEMEWLKALKKGIVHELSNQQ